MHKLIKKNGTTYDVPDTEVARLQACYKNIDVNAELHKMVLWTEANPSKRKIDVHRFIVGWLNRANERGPRQTGPVTRETSRHYALIADREPRTPEPVKYAPQEVVNSHLEHLKRTLGMRREA